MEQIYIQTSDNYQLTGHIFKHHSPERVTIIHGATGVPSGYYKPFASWLCEQKNSHVIIYDYRDSALENSQELKKSSVLMSDWGMIDQASVLDYCIRNFPELETHVIGHSLGGMCLSHQPNSGRVTSHIAVNAGPAYWPKHPWHFIPQVIAFWYLIGPLATKLFGYMPGKIIGLKADLPKDVYWQWRRWCTNPGFFEKDWGSILEKPDLTKTTCPVRLVATSDDVMIPPPRVKALAKYFPNSKINYHEIIPKSINVKEIGHIGIFARRNSAAWPQILGQD